MVRIRVRVIKIITDDAEFTFYGTKDPYYYVKNEPRLKGVNSYAVSISNEVYEMDYESVIANGKKVEVEE